MDGPYVYALIEREFIRLHEPVIKIGRSEQVKTRTCRGYPKHSLVIAIMPVRDSKAAEDALKASFSAAFLRRSEYGHEYFTPPGDYDSACQTALHMFHAALRPFSRFTHATPDAAQPPTDDDAPHLTHLRDSMDISDAEDEPDLIDDRNTNRTTDTPTDSTPLRSKEDVLIDYVQYLVQDHGMRGRWVSAGDFYRHFTSWHDAQASRLRSVPVCQSLLRSLGAYVKLKHVTLDGVIHILLPAAVVGADAAGKEYLDENKVVQTFISNHLQPDPDGFFTLKQAKEAFQKHAGLRAAGLALRVIKNALVAHLGVACLAEKYVHGRKEKSVFLGYTLLAQHDA